MRKLLIASQKGGVGKTTSAINIAGAAAVHGKRVLLIDADPLGSVPAALKLSRNANASRPPSREPVTERGLIWTDALPGVDVLSPYSDATSSSDDLARLLEALPESDFLAEYQLVVVDSPPTFSERTRALLRFCDELLLVIRAEPIAWRTLPPFLEQIREAQRETARCQFRGLLLTLSKGDEQGNAWEVELRKHLGKRVFSDTIPWDDEMTRSVLVGQSIYGVAPQSPSALAYQAAAAKLELCPPPVYPDPNAAREPEPVAPVLPVAPSRAEDRPFLRPAKAVEEGEESIPAWRYLLYLACGLLVGGLGMVFLKPH